MPLFESDKTLKKQLVEVIGIELFEQNDIEVSEPFGFNFHQYIVIAGVSYYPSKYEFSQD